MKTRILTFSLLALFAGAMSAFSAGFVGFESTSANKLGNQIANENLIQDMVNVTLVETNASKHQYSINMIGMETGSFTMGGVQFLFTPTKEGQTAYKTYETYIQPNGVDREIRIPAVKGENVRINLVDTCLGLVIDGDTMDLLPGDNFVTAKNNTMVITNPVNKPKFAAIKPEVVDAVHFWRFDEGEFAQLDDTLRSSVTIDGLTLMAAEGDYYMVLANTSTTIDGEKFTRCLKTHGTGKKDYYSLYFDVEGPCKIELFLRSQSSTADRALILECDTFGSGRSTEILASHTEAKKKTVFYKAGPTRIYLYGESGGVIIYGIRVTLGGKNNGIEWLLDKDKQLLNLDGDSVEMADFAESSPAPWHFYRSFIKKAKLSEGIFTIGNYAFNDLPLLESINIPDSVKKIGKHAFDNTTIYNNIQNWENKALYLDNWLIEATEVVGSYSIPENTVGIANDAFRTSLELSSLTCLALNPPTVTDFSFYGVNQSACTLYVPEESVEAYQTADVWKDFGAIESVEAPEEQHEAVENTSVLPASTTKTLRNGQILILRGNRTYTLTGQQIK